MGHFRKQQVTVFPTNQCNLRCVYCIASSGAEQTHPQRIDLRFAKCGITDYFANGLTALRFYSSGEPTQAMDIVKSCVEYARSLAGEQLEVEMQTNGYFSEDDALWIADNINIVWVSLDAWPEINDSYRPLPDGTSPSSVIVRNIKLMQEKTFVGARSTIVEETVDRQEEVVEYFYELGIKWLYSNPVLEPVKRIGRHGKEKITQIDVMQFAEGFVRGWKRAQELGTFYGNSLIFNFDEKVRYACRTCLPTPHLTTDGFVSACDLGFYGDSPLPDLLYGKYDVENDRIIYDEAKIKRLQSRSLENMKHCLKCDVRENCAGSCVGRAYHQTGDIFGTIPEYCRAIRYFAKHIPRNTGAVKYLHP